MALSDALLRRLTDLKGRANSLRERLRADERVEERGWARGWSPQAQVSGGGDKASQSNRHRATGGPVFDVPFASPEELPTLKPDPAALDRYEAGELWNLTEALTQLWDEAREAGRGWLLLGCTLGHCGWSDRVTEALVRAGPALEGRAQVAIARGGDRLQKVYFRDLAVGRAQISLPTFPTTLAFEVTPRGLTLTALAFDALGPDPDHSKILGLLEGRSAVPEGSDHFFVGVCVGMMCTRLDASVGFEGKIEIPLV